VVTYKDTLVSIDRVSATRGDNLVLPDGLREIRDVVLDDLANQGQVVACSARRASARPRSCACSQGSTRVGRAR